MREQAARRAVGDQQGRAGLHRKNLIAHRHLSRAFEKMIDAGAAGMGGDPAAGFEAHDDHLDFGVLVQHLRLRSARREDHFARQSGKKSVCSTDSLLNSLS